MILFLFGLICFSSPISHSQGAASDRNFVFIPLCIHGKTPDNYLICGKIANKKLKNATFATLVTLG